MWKERKGLMRFRGSKSRFWLSILSPVLLATVVPWQWGPEWVEQVPALVLAFVMAIALVGLTIPDSFAGERERDTLETLLASRLPDRAILLGKVGVCVTFSFCATVIVLFLSLLSTNIAHWQGHVILYTLPIGLGSLGLSLLASTLVAGAGVLVSLRSDSAQEAAQRLMAFFLVPPVVLQVGAMVFMDRLGDLIDSVNGPRALLITLAVLVLLNVVIYLIVFLRFRRSRLISD
jgi:ABC-2 type transport system permease protein